MLKCLLCFLSGICVTCRKMLKALADNEQISTIPPSGEIEVDLNVVEQMGNLTLVSFKRGISFPSPLYRPQCTIR